ncbi:MAG: DUF7681 family protein [Sinimarinibacterium flocculans]|uniref:Acb2/Tad1 domain-containing protein n=1 Tax=Sinimarinibacterium flocculans TaxID=985250 RepID=UPI003C3AC3C5
MENQHQKIKGYRDLTQEEIDLMNEVKAEGERLGQLVDRVSKITDVDLRWVSIAKTDLQKGVMSLVRSIARPTTF